MKKENDLLYLAMTNEKGFWTHVYLSDGKVVQVTHASAALDAVTYTKTNSVWRTSDTFTYEMRDNVYNAETEAKLQRYFEANGWVANNSNLGWRKSN